MKVVMMGAIFSTLLLRLSFLFANKLTIHMESTSLAWKITFII